MELQSAASRYEDFYIIEKGLSTNTYLGYKNDLRLFFSYLRGQGVEDTQKISFEHIQGFLSQRSLQISAKTLNREKSAIKNFLLYCQSLELTKDNYSQLLVSDNKDEFFPQVLTQEEMSRLFDYIEKQKSKTTSYRQRLAERDHLMLEMLYGLGLRVSELINIHVSDLDREGWCRIKGKGEKVRTVPLLAQTSKRISFYLKEVRPQFLPKLALKNLKLQEEDILFLNKHGKKLSRIAVWKWVKDISLKARITKNISPHTFRHTCATHLLQNGADLRMIQELVGHSSIQTTELYTHLLTEDVQQTFAEYHPLYN